MLVTEVSVGALAAIKKSGRAVGRDIISGVELVTQAADDDGVVEAADQQRGAGEDDVGERNAQGGIGDGEGGSGGVGQGVVGEIGGRGGGDRLGKIELNPVRAEHQSVDEKGRARFCKDGENGCAAGGGVADVAGHIRRHHGKLGAVVRHLRAHQGVAGIGRVGDRAGIAIPLEGDRGIADGSGDGEGGGLGFVDREVLGVSGDGHRQLGAKLLTPMKKLAIWLAVSGVDEPLSSANKR